MPGSLILEIHRSQDKERLSLELIAFATIDRVTAMAAFVKVEGNHQTGDSLALLANSGWCILPFPEPPLDPIRHRA